LIDSGFNTYRVYEACRASGNFFWPVKGSNVTMGSRISKSFIEDFKVPLLTFSDHALKSELYLDRIKNGKRKVHIPADAGADFIRGLSGQMLVPKKTPSGTDFVWKSIAQDHYSDALKLCVLSWHLMRDQV
jgi:phage terminase large subunit GpA-like protein